MNGGTGVDKRSGDYTVIQDTADDNWTVSVDDDAAFYTVDKKGNISTGSYRSVVKDNNDKVYAVISDYLVQSLFIETVEDDEKDSGKVEIPSNVVVDISDLNSMTVTYRTGTDKCVFTNIVSTNDGGIGTNSRTYAKKSFGVLGFTVDSTTSNGNIGKDTRST